MGQGAGDTGKLGKSDSRSSFASLEQASWSRCAVPVLVWGSELLLRKLWAALTDPRAGAYFKTNLCHDLSTPEECCSVSEAVKSSTAWDPLHIGT